MARLTKIRGGQTRAKDYYDPTGDSLAADYEVEQRVKKHSKLFHHARPEISEISYTADGSIERISIYDETKTNIIASSNFVFSADGNISELSIEKIDETGKPYLSLKKTFIYDATGNITGITNEVL